MITHIQLRGAVCQFDKDVSKMLLKRKKKEKKNSVKKKKKSKRRQSARKPDRKWRQKRDRKWRLWPLPRPELKAGGWEWAGRTGALWVEWSCGESLSGFYEMALASGKKASQYFISCGRNTSQNPLSFHSRYYMNMQKRAMTHNLLSYVLLPVSLFRHSSTIALNYN